MAGFLTFTFKVYVMKILGLKIEDLRYYRIDLNDFNMPENAPSFKKLDFDEIKEAAKTDSGNVFLYPEKLRRIKQALDTGTQECYALFVGEKLASFGLINYHLSGRRLDKVEFTEQDAYLWDDFTYPEFRGKGLHATSIRHRLMKAKENGKRYAWSSVYLHNKASANNFLSVGFLPVFDVCTVRRKNGKVLLKRIKMKNPGK